ncbi:MAG: hypothetical protein M1540_01215 [Candidatus Bathyarchaeota archaeon]|nr:hypothetical protein [Candidatus Bathyarchaeota archaeon]
MKFSLKITLALCLFSLSLAFSTAAAQSSIDTGVVSPTTTTLNAVCVVNSPDANGDLTTLEAWAVGDAGTIVHWNANSWTTVPSPTASHLYSVAFNNVTNGWAVGGSGNSGVILHYNGTWNVWSRISFSGFTDAFDTINSTLHSVTITTDGMMGWIVGAGGLTLNWNGDTWFAITDVTPNTLRAVAMAHNSAEAWAVGDAGTIMHWTGSNWETMTSPTNAPLYTIQMLDTSNGWVAGGSNNNGVVLNLNQSTWQVWDKFNFGTMNTTTPSQSVNSTIYSISVGNATSAWACGSNGLVMYWTGTQWDCNINLISGNLRGISMIHGETTGMLQAWAVGDGGQIMAFNGMAWVPEIPIIAVSILLAAVLFVVVLAKPKLLRKTLLFK